MINTLRRATMKVLMPLRAAHDNGQGFIIFSEVLYALNRSGKARPTEFTSFLNQFIYFAHHIVFMLAYCRYKCTVANLIHIHYQKLHLFQ
jgi:K+-transporting ATPase A subunit